MLSPFCRPLFPFPLFFFRFKVLISPLPRVPYALRPRTSSLYPGLSIYPTVNPSALRTSARVLVRVLTVYGFSIAAQNPYAW